MTRLYIFIVIIFTLPVQGKSQNIVAVPAGATQEINMTPLQIAELCYHGDSTRIDCLKTMAEECLRSGDQANAKLYYHKITKKDSSDAQAYINLASIYEQQLQLPKAIKYYTIVNKLLPDEALYYRKNAALYHSYNDLRMAYQLYARANKLNPKDVLSLKGLAEIAMSNDNMALSDSLIRAALQLDTMHIAINYLQAKSKYKQQHFDSVTFVYHRISGQVDLNSYHNKMLGYAYLQIDSVDLAISKLQLALTDDPESEKLHYYLATAYEKQDNIQGALDHYERAVKHAISPDLDLYHRHVGRIANGEKLYQKAISAYQDAYKYGDDPVILYYLAACTDHYYKDKSIAINYYSKYLKSDHNHAAYKDYAAKRMRYLKEQKFQSTSSN